MGAYSNLDLEQQSGTMGVNVQTTTPPQSTAQNPISSPFVSGAFSTSPFVSAVAPKPAPEQAAAQAAPAEAATEAAVPEAVDSQSEADDEAAKRKAHEEAEAKRKAEWEAKFAERRAKEKAERERIAALSDDAVMEESSARVSKGFEQLTRRNMKDMVSEYVQTMCFSDPTFARNVMNPLKSMINCVKYINNKAREYIRKDMEDNDMKPENGMYGGDVPDDVVYQWAVDYFNDPNAKEDEREEEKFKPKPYIGKNTSSAKSKKDKEKAKKEAEKKGAEKKAAEEKAKKKADDGQLSLLGAA